MEDKKSITFYLQRLDEGEGGIFSGGFGSIRGGFKTVGPLNNTGSCTNGVSCAGVNSGTCSGSNSRTCTNSGDCSKTTNSHLCSNSTTCPHSL